VEAGESSLSIWWYRLRLFGGPLLSVVVYLLTRLAWEPAASATAALAAWMAWWWITEAIPLAATALMPIIFLPLAGVYSESPTRPIVEALRPYADPNVFTYFGGFVLALAIERWGLHRRLALAMLIAIGTSPARLLAGVMAATGFLSMWISNTAATTIMLPMGLGIAGLLSGDPQRSTHITADRQTDSRNQFTASLLLGIAYAASIGGMATIVGTPTNGVAINVIHGQQVEVDFQAWFISAGPVALLIMIACWLCLAIGLRRETKVFDEHAARQRLMEQWHALGSWSRGERLAGIVFAATAISWILRGALIDGLGLGRTLPALRQIDDTWIAVTAAIALFAIPVDLRRGEFLMDWQTMRRLPWGVLLLFGGGLSLAAALQVSGVLAEIEQLLRGLRGIPRPIVVILLIASVSALTELVSNVAVATALTPVIMALGIALDLPVVPLVMAAALASSCAFMLPVATPPNAIVFGSGLVSQQQMIRAGLLLDCVSVVILVGAVPWLARFTWETAAASP
jgi:sodium-dependent dicarboxylate transporter 2/3/5